MNTIELARKARLVEILEVHRGRPKECFIQPFDYLFVLDFEATCWDANDITKCESEIIEFPVVLFDIKSNKIVSEYQQYVMPMEVPKLSEFCKQLTGIRQDQVDNGVPLGTCIMLFTTWLKQQMKMYNLVLSTEQLCPNTKKAMFVTWSDWDLKICLLNECKRKRITKPDVFNKWIDLRMLYLEHYNRRPKGLNGALTEVGLTFDGTQHCGLHDARNTAILAGRMIADGVLLRITKDISLKFNAHT